MREILALFQRHPELVLFLLFWVLSAVFGALRKAKQVQRRRGMTPSDPTTRQARSPAPERPLRSPEDIARELRRMMGLETEPEPPTTKSLPEPEVEWQPEPEQSRWVEPSIGDLPTVAMDGRPGQALHERIAERRPSLGGRIAHSAVVYGRRPASRMAFDGKDPVRAIVAMEVLGPPRGLRPWS